MNLEGENCSATTLMSAEKMWGFFKEVRFLAVKHPKILKKLSLTNIAGSERL